MKNIKQKNTASFKVILYLLSKSFILLLFVIMLSFFNSCKKEEPTNNEPSPIACLSPSKTMVMAGESFAVRNCSSGSNFLWEDGDNYEEIGYLGQTRYVKYNNVGTYFLKISAFNANKSQKSTDGRWITVTEPLGNVIFWQSGTPSYDITTVYINGESMDITINTPYGPSDCFKTGCAHFTLPPGTYNFYAATLDGNYKWNGQVTVYLGDCTKMQLN